jgi:predicted amidophosphoribosyltransferase
MQNAFTICYGRFFKTTICHFCNQVFKRNQWFFWRVKLFLDYESDENYFQCLLCFWKKKLEQNVLFKITFNPIMATKLGYEKYFQILYEEKWFACKIATYVRQTHVDMAASAVIL